MARQFTVTLTSGTDSGPYNIYYDMVLPGALATLCGTSNLAENLTLSQVQSGVCVEVPNDADRIIFYNTNPDIEKDCETNQEVHELTNAPSPTPTSTATPTPTESSTPTPTPTPSPTEDIACQCFEFINTTLGNISYTYTDCNGTSVEAVSDKEPWTFYVCAQSIDSVTSNKLTYSVYGPCTDGVCVNTPSPTPTNTPTPTPTSTPTPTPTSTPTPTPSSTEPEVFQQRDRKFSICGTTPGSPFSDEVETQAASADESGESNVPILIYLTIDEYGSTPESGDKVRVNFGTSDQHCYEYVGIETGEENTSLVVELDDCTCDAPQGVCKFFEVGSEVDQSRYGLNWVPSDSSVGTTATFNSMISTSLGGEFGSSIAVGVCTATGTTVSIWDSNDDSLVANLAGVSTLSQRDSSCDETSAGRCEYNAPDETTQTNRTVTGCTSGNIYVINHNETCNAGNMQMSENELQLDDVIWITVGDNSCGDAVDECATVGQVTNDEVTAVRRGQNIFNGCSNDEGNSSGCYMP